MGIWAFLERGDLPFVIIDKDYVTTDFREADSHCQADVS
jgi:hypothetical protein